MKLVHSSVAESDKRKRLKPEDVFSIHPKIRWAGLATDDGRIIFAKMRDGIQSYTSTSEDQAFMEIGALLMTATAERLSPDDKAGKLECVIPCFEKVCVLVAKAGNSHLALSVDREDALSLFVEIMPKIRKLTIEIKFGSVAGATNFDHRPGIDPSAAVAKSPFF